MWTISHGSIHCCLLSQHTTTAQHTPAMCCGPCCCHGLRMRAPYSTRSAAPGTRRPAACWHTHSHLLVEQQVGLLRQDLGQRHNVHLVVVEVQPAAVGLHHVGGVVPACEEQGARGR
jgi:hypothetical protein